MRSILIITASLVCGIILTSLPKQNENREAKHCVFRTLFGEDPVGNSVVSNPSQQIETSIDQGLRWLESAQQNNGAWGCGSHHRQNITDPHQVQTDPATTAMVGMALLRTGSTFDSGPHHKEIQKATAYLLAAVEDAIPDGSNITGLKNTQIQSKLGTNIDLILTTQFLTNLLPILDEKSKIRKRVFSNLNVCVDKVQLSQDVNGSFKGAGWAGVLQSSLANNALETAQRQGAWVDDVALVKSRDYQKSNFDVTRDEVKTSDGAGVVLYAVSGSTRASAKEARKARELLKKAKEKGAVEEEAEVNVGNLKKAGMDQDQAMKLYSSYQVYNAAKIKAQDKNVISGFGNNGGEEFLSYLQTGESLVINKDDTWENWFENVSDRLLKIQNQDGSWNGHHCITSPVFCTATCLLILSIHNDIDELANVGITDE